MNSVQIADYRPESKDFESDIRRKEMRNFVLSALTVLSTFSFAEGSSTTNLIWRARGLQAIEKMEELAKKKSLTDQQKCEAQLESMFMQFANPEMSKIVIKKAQGIEWFIMAAKTADGVGQISFGYEAGKNEVYGWKVVQPGKDWQILNMNAKGKWKPFVAIGKCHLMLDLDNPIATTVMFFSENQK